MTQSEFSVDLFLKHRPLEDPAISTFFLDFSNRYPEYWTQINEGIKFRQGIQKILRDSGKDDSGKDDSGKDNSGKDKSREGYWGDVSRLLADGRVRKKTLKKENIQSVTVKFQNHGTKPAMLLGLAYYRGSDRARRSLSSKLKKWPSSLIEAVCKELDLETIPSEMIPLLERCQPEKNVTGAYRKHFPIIRC
jgi:hypothetical protein